MNLAMERVGARLYVTGDAYSIKDKLKSLGCHWDGARCQWWIGIAKSNQLWTLLSTAQADPASAPEDMDGKRVDARVKYKGRIYYQIGATRDGARVRLSTLDGKVSFWTDAAQAETVKTYAPRTYRGRTEYTTLGGIRRFVERQRDPATRRGECTECGALGPPGEACPECGGEGSFV